jgi:metal-sulfur cluster biosynthetic enzyme
VKDKVPTTADVIKRRLKNVMNPITGLDIVRGELVKDIKIEDGHVDIYVDLPENHIFAGNIRDEVKERVETLWDVKKVEIHFNDQ